MSFFSKKSILRFATLKGFFIALSVILLIQNSVILYKAIRSRQARLKIPLIRFYPGLEFAGLEDLIKVTDAIGYYSDLDLTKRENLARLTRAQYALAPVILDVDYAEHAYIIFDATTAEKNLKKIRETGAVPIKQNRFGVILGKIPK